MYEERNPIKSTNMIGLLTCERMWEPTFHSCTSSSSEGGRMRDLVHLCEVIMKRLSTLFLSVRKNTLQLELENNIVDNECWISTWYSKRFRTNLFFKKRKMAAMSRHKYIHFLHYVIKNGFRGYFVRILVPLFSLLLFLDWCLIKWNQNSNSNDNKKRQDWFIFFFVILWPS